MPGLGGPWYRDLAQAWAAWAPHLAHLRPNDLAVLRAWQQVRLSHPFRASARLAAATQRRLLPAD